MIRVSLDAFLKRHNLTPYRLTQETRGRVARGSIYALTHGDEVKRVDLATLSEVMRALTRLTGQAVTPNDLLEVREPGQDAAARAEALALLSTNPWGKKPAGLAVPVPFEGKAFEVIVAEQRAEKP